MSSECACTQGICISNMNPVLCIDQKVQNRQGIQFVVGRTDRKTNRQTDGTPLTLDTILITISALSFDHAHKHTNVSPEVCLFLFCLFVLLVSQNVFLIAHCVDYKYPCVGVLTFKIIVCLFWDIRLPRGIRYMPVTAARYPVLESHTQYLDIPCS